MGAARHANDWVLALLLVAISSCSTEVPFKPTALVHVTGMVRDRDGAGIPGVRIDADLTSALPAYGRGGAGQAITDSAGMFAFDLLEAWYQFTIYPPDTSGYDFIRLDQVRIRKDTPTFEYRYSGIRIRGMLLGPGAVPVDGGFVFIGDDEGTYASFFRSHQGIFSFLAPHAGLYYMGAQGPNASGLPSKDFRLNVVADTMLTVSLDGFPVTGTVRGPTGAPLESVLVAAASTTDQTGAGSLTAVDGSYRVYLPQGGYRFRLYPPPTSSYIVPVQTTPVSVMGPTSHDFDLDGTMWSGTVRDQGQPAAGMEVDAIEAGGYYPSAKYTTGLDGSYRLVVTPGRDYALRVGPPGGYSTTRAFIPSVIAGADSTFDIPLDPLP